MYFNIKTTKYEGMHLLKMQRLDGTEKEHSQCSEYPHIFICLDIFF